MHTPTRPQWTEQDAIDRAREAVRVYTPHAAALTASLDAGLIDGLNAARVALGDTTALSALTRQKTATGAKHDASEDGHDLLIAVREVVTDAHAPSEIQKAVGVGDNVGKHDTRKIAAALQSIVEHAADLVRYGIAAETIHEADELARTLEGKTDAQSTAFTARHDTTDARTAAQLRLEHAVKQIAHRGALKFRKDPIVRAQFRALIAHHAHPAAPEPTPAPGGAAPVTPG